MILIPDNFPSYTAYNAKQLLQHVDTLKSATKELQDQVNLINSHILSLKEQVAELDRRLEIIESASKKAK